MKILTFDEIKSYDKPIAYRMIYRSTIGSLVAMLQCATNSRTDEYSIFHNPDVKTHGEYLINDVVHAHKDKGFYAAIFKMERTCFILYRDSSYAIEIPAAIFKDKQGAVMNAARQLH